MSALQQISNILQNLINLFLKSYSSVLHLLQDLLDTPVTSVKHKSQYLKVMQCNLGLCFKENIGKETESRSKTVKQNKTDHFFQIF